MIYVIGLALYFVAVARAARSMKDHRAALSKSGVSKRSYDLLRLGLWLYFVPPLGELNPVPILAWQGLPLPFSVLLFTPGIVAALRMRRTLPRGGYDYQARAAAHVVTVLLLGLAGIGLVVLRWMPR